MSAPGVRELGTGERVVMAAVGAAAAGLGVVGMVNSFARVAEAVEPSFGPLAWTVPLAIDLGIAVFTGADLVLARLGMRARWLRLVPWTLVATTVMLNVAGESFTGAVAHAVVAGLWVIAVEAGMHVLRAVTGLQGAARAGMDRVRVSRWLLAPVATVRLWRRMVLWEVTDYPTALRRERDRLLARCELVDRYGRLVWRWKAPRAERVLYRLGELAPTTALDTATPAPVSAPAPPVRRVRKTTAPSSTARRSTSVPAGELLEAGRAVAAELAASGRGLSRRTLVEGLRARGVSVSTARAGELLTHLRTSAGADDVVLAGLERELAEVGS